MSGYQHTPEELEWIERNARADETSRGLWAEMSYPPHNAEYAEYGECLCETCQEVANRDPG